MTIEAVAGGKNALSLMGLLVHLEGDNCDLNFYYLAVYPTLISVLVIEHY